MFQPGEALEVVVGGVGGVALLEGQGGDMSVGGEISRRARCCNRFRMMGQCPDPGATRRDGDCASHSSM